jgi:4-amino-4-deoxy-L-arabinose transferase-like glycosyltransferase
MVIACALITASLRYLGTELTYDEAVYLRLARTITERGLPLRRAYEDFSQFRLFENSPPLVLYLTSISQKVFPGHDVPARVVHLALFVLPTYILVWWVARVKFGAWAAFASLVALLTSISYLRATTHVLLNVPLGLLACIGLVAFHEASVSPVRRRSYLSAAALAIVLAVWTKYQAVCIAAAILSYVIYIVSTRGSAGFRSVFVPLSTIAIGGATAVITLVWFFWTFGGNQTLTATLTANVGRASTVSMSALEIAGAVMSTVRECESTLGGVALLLGAFAMCVEHRHRGLVVLLASYVAATIAFNLVLFRLPGAGSSYLHSAVPALALLAGPAAVRVIELATTTATRALVACAAIAIQIAGSPSRPDEVPVPNGSRVAAGYIAAHSTPPAGVLAETVAIEFYSGHPVRAVGNTYPKHIVLQSLEGKSGDDISFVVVKPGVAPKNLEALRQQWDTLLAEHFELVSTAAPGLHVYRRRTR